MEKVYLVTGATGFLGRKVVKQLTVLQKKVIGLRLPRDKVHLLPGAEYIIGDITKPHSCKNFLNGQRRKRLC